MKKTIDVSLKLIIAYLLIFTVMHIFYAARVLNADDGIRFLDIYSYGNKKITSAVEGSGGFISIRVFNEDDFPIVKDLIKQNTEITWLEICKYDLLGDRLKSLSDGNLIIADIDFDNRIELATYSKTMYKIGGIIEI